ncbi:MAG: DUF4150 domain-containing protein [Burkholderiaceae bacterium]|nr:DUF4150 domain-containing protein [Burkholderiaceae bacterium]
MANNALGARKDSSFKAVSTAPSINKTPAGSAMVPVPYPTTQDLSNSVSVVANVKFNGDPCYTLDHSTQPSCKGDNPGTGTGVKSGTVNGEVKQNIALFCSATWIHLATRRIWDWMVVMSQHLRDG